MTEIGCGGKARLLLSEQESRPPAGMGQSQGLPLLALRIGPRAHMVKGAMGHWTEPSPGHLTEAATVSLYSGKGPERPRVRSSRATGRSRPPHAAVGKSSSNTC